MALRLHFDDDVRTGALQSCAADQNYQLGFQARREWGKREGQRAAFAFTLGRLWARTAKPRISPAILLCTLQCSASLSSSLKDQHRLREPHESTVKCMSFGHVFCTRTIQSCRFCSFLSRSAVQCQGRARMREGAQRSVMCALHSAMTTRPCRSLHANAHSPRPLSHDDIAA